MGVTQNKVLHHCIKSTGEAIYPIQRSPGTRKVETEELMSEMMVFRTTFPPHARKYRSRRFANYGITNPQCYCANTLSGHDCTIDTMLGCLIQHLMPLPPFTTCLNLHTFQHPPFQIFISYVHPDESSMGRIEFVWLNGPPYLQDLGRWQRDHVRDGPLKAVARLTWWARMGCVGRLVR